MITSRKPHIKRYRAPWSDSPQWGVYTSRRSAKPYAIFNFWENLCHELAERHAKKSKRKPQ